MEKQTQNLHYTTIRTPNMPSDRSADRSFDPERAVKLPDGKTEYPDASLAKQSFAQECDINYILKNNALVAPLTPEQYQAQNFVDLGNAVDYHFAKNYLIEANNAFMSLDANIRARFQNDPGRFFDFVQNPDNQEELITLGLATRSGDVPAPQPEPTPSKQKKTPVKAPEEPQE